VKEKRHDRPLLLTFSGFSSFRRVTSYNDAMYYLITKGTQTGPFSLERLREFWQEGISTATRCAGGRGNRTGFLSAT